jgi:hypothetical protein
VGISNNPSSGSLLKEKLKRIQFWSGKLYRRAIQAVASRIYINPAADLRRSILVAGAARSGTTWLGDLIASQIPCRILFEPFNPRLVPQYRNFHYFQYLRPGLEYPAFRTFAQEVFTGKLRNRWIDHQNERVVSEYRLIKEIRANLALKWLHDNFPEIPMLFLMRHPCAVVSSRMELDWATDNDIEPFLSQPDLIDDHLGPYLHLIENAKTAEEKHAIVWSVSNLVPLKQFKTGELKLVYYEDLCTQPQAAMIFISDSIGQRFLASVIDTIDQPSQTARVTSAVVTGVDKISSWRNKLSPPQIDNILGIVDQFGLSHLYDASLMPLKKDAN